ncbi:MAG: class I SAM-dependent methyltransferase [Cyanobacteria bacterium J06642_2]
MTETSNSLFDRFILPLLKVFPVDREALAGPYRQIDWQKQCHLLTDPTLEYPDYYRNTAFHGVEGGYLTSGAAVTYDPVTQYALPPNEQWVRQTAIDVIQGRPRRILDLGCGTGSTTLMLKQVFPSAEVIGLDLSPHMLVVAEQKSRQARLPVTWKHGNATSTPFPDASFDLVTMTLLLHETPSAISRQILSECFRLLKDSGEIVILDGNQTVLKQVDWLNDIFTEPYIREYASGDLTSWLHEAQFEAVQLTPQWWLHQTARAMKPLGVAKAASFSTTEAFPSNLPEFVPA